MTSCSVKMVKRLKFNFIRNWNQLINMKSISTLEHLLFNLIVYATLTTPQLHHLTSLRKHARPLFSLFCYWLHSWQSQNCTALKAINYLGCKTIFWGRETVIYRLEFRSILTFKQISNSNWIFTGRKNGFAQICSRQICSKIVTTEG